MTFACVVSPSRWKRWSEKRDLRADVGSLGGQTPRREDRDDRRDLSKSTTDCDQHGRQKKWARGRLIGRTKGAINTKIHVISDSLCRPIDLFVTAGQVSDYIGERALLNSLPKVKWPLGDRGNDADWFREALQDNKGIRACIPGRKQRMITVKYDKRGYKRRNRIGIMFARLKDLRRVATRYDRCPKVFLSAIALAATVIYWL